jgi:hypothetical protein
MDDECTVPYGQQRELHLLTYLLMVSAGLP